MRSTANELVLWIHYLAENPAFPLTHPVIYSNTHYASTRYIARYLLSLHRASPDVLTACLRHPICSLEVVKEIQRICDRPLRCTLPTRLFRRDVSPLLEHLFATYAPSPNAHNGYPLSRAVLSANVPLIRFLLDKGAHPGVRGGLAVRTAVRMKRLDLVRLLVDAGYKPGSELVEMSIQVGADDITQYFVALGVMPPLRSIMRLGKRKRV